LVRILNDRVEIVKIDTIYSKRDFMVLCRNALCHKIPVPDPNLVENDGSGSILNERGSEKPVKSNERAKDRQNCVFV
jgi:hypothetical protein